jgi:hypothetical protein
LISTAKRRRGNRRRGWAKHTAFWCRRPRGCTSRHPQPPPAATFRRDNWREQVGLFEHHTTGFADDVERLGLQRRGGPTPDLCLGHHAAKRHWSPRPLQALIRVYNTVRCCNLWKQLGASDVLWHRSRRRGWASEGRRFLGACYARWFAWLRCAGGGLCGGRLFMVLRRGPRPRVRDAHPDPRPCPEEV